MSNIIEMDKTQREAIWQEYQKNGKFSGIKEKIYEGRTGICREETGKAISLFLNGKSYKDQDFGTYIIYKYPDTKRPSNTDKDEIDSVKRCQELNLPLFIVFNQENRIGFGYDIFFDDTKREFTIKYK